MTMRAALQSSDVLQILTGDTRKIFVSSSARYISYIHSNIFSYTQKSWNYSFVANVLKSEINSNKPIKRKESYFISVLHIQGSIYDVRCQSFTVRQGQVMHFVYLAKLICTLQLREALLAARRGLAIKCIVLQLKSEY